MTFNDYNSLRQPKHPKTLAPDKPWKWNYIDLFSGIGGFHLGLLLAGFKFNWVGYSEIDKYAIKVYQKNFPNAENLGDIKNVDGRKIKESIGEIDFITGGFP